MRRFFFLLLFLSACTNRVPDALPTLAPLPEDIRPLPYWETVTGTLMEIGTSQYWQFAGEANASIFIAAVSRETEVLMRLYLGESLIAEANRIETTLPAAGLYRLEVTLISGAGTYDLGLGYQDRPNPNESPPVAATVGVPTPTPSYANLGEFIGSLSVPTPYAGLLTANSPVHIYTLQGRAGAVVSFELYRIAGTLDPVLRLFDSSGQIIAEDDNALGGLNARLLNIVLPSTELYTIQIGGKGLYGDYSLVFVDGEQNINPDRLPTLAPTTIVPYITPIVRIAAPDARLEDHFPVISAIVSEGNFQRFSFNADIGERVSVVVQPEVGSNLLPQLEIFNPSGAQIAIAQGSVNNGIAAVMNLEVTESGTHGMIITGENSSTGQFTISYGRGVSNRDEFVGTAISNLSQEGRIDTLGTRDVWQLTLNPRDVVTIAVSPNDANFDPVIELVTAEGIVLYQDDNSGGNRAARLQLAEIHEPATYLLRVYDATGANIGGYTLLWRYVNLAPTATPIPRTTSLLNIEAFVELQQYEFFSFQGQAGQTVQIDVTAAISSPLDPVLVLIAPNNEEVGEADDSNGTLNPSLQISLPTSGTYRVRVNGYLSGGAFTLRVALLWD